MSAALFNNAAFTEVLVATHKILAAGDEQVTTRQVAAATGRGDSVVRPVMNRLVAAGLLVDSGPSGGARPFTRSRPDLWRELLGVVSVVTDTPIELLDVATGT